MNENSKTTFEMNGWNFDERGNAKKKTAIQHEANEQEALFRWAEFYKEKYPELELLHHIPNGGKRDKREAARLKRQGVKAGVPDLCLPVPRGKYHGLYIELKYGGNKPTEKQMQWLYKLQKQGYVALYCYGWEQASKVIVNYLKIKEM